MHRDGNPNRSMEIWQTGVFSSNYRSLGVKTSAESQRELTGHYKAESRASEIEQGLKELSANFITPTDVPEKFAYVEGSDFEDYLHDMRIFQRFADLNRQAMAREIISGMGFHEIDRFTTIHNYIDTEHRILQKGSAFAQKGERLLIPINMRDGALICIGKGNP